MSHLSEKPELRMGYPSFMTTLRRWRWGFGLLILALGYLSAFYLTPGFLADSDGKPVAGECVSPRRVDLDHGEHKGQPWRINASIEKIERRNRCSYWFLKVQFSPQGVLPGSWTEGWGIPAGGHLPATATIDASEEEEGRAIGGVVGSRVHSVILRFSSGRAMAVHPKDPRKQLLKRFVWLHDLRYFLIYFPSGESVKTAELLDAAGKVILTVHSQEGELVGNMVY